jgi:DNA-binding CsgD family transcriptional regulator
MKKKVEQKELLTYKDFLSQMNALLPSDIKQFTGVKSEDDLLRNPVFYKLMSEAPSIMLIFNFSTMVYDYFSPNTKSIMGYASEKLVGMTGAEFAISIFLPEHLSILIELNSNIAMKYYHEYAALKKAHEVKLSYTCKLRRADGTYVWALMQTMVLDVHENGFPRRTIAFLTDINEIKSDEKVNFNVAIRSNVGYETLYSIHYDKNEPSLLSRREMEILNLLGKGFKSAEIAEKLNISKDTVKTHRKNILKKTGKTSFIQLLN